MPKAPPQIALYGNWEEELSIEGELFRADRIEDKRAQRAGFHTIFAIDGLPSSLENHLVRAAQACDVPHTWCVKEHDSEDAVSDETIQLGRKVLREDQERYNAHVFTYVGINADDSEEYHFLAAGAVRNKLTPTYENNAFPVVSRAVVAPAHRGKGLGTVIVQHRMMAVLSYFSAHPKAIHFATESPQIFSAIHSVEPLLGAPFVHIGNEQYETKVGLQVVQDFLCFLPEYQNALLNAVQQLAVISDTPLGELKKALTDFMQRGVETVTGKKLETLIAEATDGHAPSTSVSLLQEVIDVRNTIGARDIL